jgi:hypothetical protein
MWVWRWGHASSGKSKKTFGLLIRSCLRRALCRVKDCALNVAPYFLFSILRSSRISIEDLSLRKRAFGNYGVITVTLLLSMFAT